MIAGILVGAAVLVVLLVVVAATRPAAYAVERSVEVAAPSERVFGVVEDAGQLANVLMLFGAPVAEQGAKAKLTIEERAPGRHVRVRLDISAPMKSTAVYTFGVDGSRVTCAMRGNHNFVGRFFGLFVNMDRMLAADLDKGLARLKTIVAG